MTDPVDCAIIGAGPGGLTAAIHLSRFRRPIVLFDAGNSRARWIPESHNCPGFPTGINGDAFLGRLHQQARASGARVEADEVVRLQRDGELFVLEGAGDRVVARNVILATGCEDVLPDIDDLDEAVACGAVRFCPICDAFEAIDRDIALYGPLDAAVSHARFLRTYSDRVTIVPTDLPADRQRTLRLRDDGVAVCTLPESIRFDGERCGFGFGDRFRTFDVVYAMLGSRQRSELALSLGAACDDERALHVDDHLETSVPGLYAIGDVVSALNQIAVATGHAAIAATAVHNALPARFA